MNIEQLRVRAPENSNVIPLPTGFKLTYQKFLREKQLSKTEGAKIPVKYFQDNAIIFPIEVRFPKEDFHSRLVHACYFGLDVNEILKEAGEAGENIHEEPFSRFSRGRMAYENPLTGDPI